MKVSYTKRGQGEVLYGTTSCSSVEEYVEIFNKFQCEFDTRDIVIMSDALTIADLTPYFLLPRYMNCGFSYIANGLYLAAFNMCKMSYKRRCRREDIVFVNNALK